MILDFHTHVYPEHIAKKVIKNLGQDTYYGVYGDGTINGLLTSMRESGIDYCVTLPIVTKPEQYKSILEFSKVQLSIRELIPFAGIHPKCEKIDEKLAEIQENGFPGIKLHPDYQGFYIDDDKSVSLIRAALERELIVLVHSGVDESSMDDIHCTPERVARCLEQIPEIEQKGLPFIVAHTGGADSNYNFDDVERYLVGKNIFMDISFTLGLMKEEQFLRIIRNHGASRVLFGTDSPWTKQKEELEKFLNLPLEEEEKEKILWKNGVELLKDKRQRRF